MTHKTCNVLKQERNQNILITFLNVVILFSKTNIRGKYFHIAKCSAVVYFSTATEKLLKVFSCDI